MRERVDGNITHFLSSLCLSLSLPLRAIYCTRFDIIIIIFFMTICVPMMFLSFLTGNKRAFIIILFGRVWRFTGVVILARVIVSVVCGDDFAPWVVRRDTSPDATMSTLISTRNICRISRVCRVMKWQRAVSPLGRREGYFFFKDKKHHIILDMNLLFHKTHEHI